MNFIESTKRAVIAMVALGIFAVGNAQAAQCSLVPDGTASMEGFENAKLLSDGKFSQVEANLEKWHKKNLSSDGGDLLTLRNIVELLQLSGQQENLVLMWADQSPKSFFAQLSAGFFYSDQASNARGNDFISKTNERQLANMKKLDETATEYMQKAMQLNARSALPHSAMLGIAARGEGQAAGKSAEQWLQAANQVDPKNLAARIKSVNFLSPRWGGSFELLDQMTQQARKPLSAKSAHYLEYNVVLAKASHEEIIAKNKAKANELYKRAKEMCENSETAQEGVIRTYK